MFFDQMGSRHWRVRRRIVILVLLWCAGMVTYLSVWGRPISLSEATVNGVLLLMASTLGSYVFGAVWDNKVGAGRPDPGIPEGWPPDIAPPPEDDRRAG